MDSTAYKILLADDDHDEYAFFNETLAELPFKTSLQTVSNGEQLMELLENSVDDLPKVLFLDLNMPLKNGFDCLTEIKQHKKLSNLPVIIYTTSLDKVIIDLLYEQGALYYITKPEDYHILKITIARAISLIKNSSNKPLKSDFVL